MAFARPPWTARSAWASPARPSVSTRMRPAIGSLKIPVAIDRPLHGTVLALETFTETTRMVPSDVREAHSFDPHMKHSVSTTSTIVPHTGHSRAVGLPGGAIVGAD